MKVKARKIHLSPCLDCRASGNLHDFVCKLIFTAYMRLSPDFFLLVDLSEFFFSDLGSGGQIKINKKPLKMTS